MKRDDIIRMAREAEWHVSGSRVLSPVVEGTDLLWLLERFAAIVAAAEREACAKVCEEIYTGEEACGDWPTPEMCATAIQARGQQ